MTSSTYLTLLVWGIIERRRLNDERDRFAAVSLPWHLVLSVL